MYVILLQCLTHNPENFAAGENESFAQKKAHIISKMREGSGEDEKENYINNKISITLHDSAFVSDNINSISGECVA